MTLDDVFAKHGTDKHEHGYAAAYERHLPPRDALIRLVEVGVLRGESLRAWREWFLSAEIVGIDDQRYGLVEDVPGCPIVRGNVLGVDPMSCDVFVDDGSHLRSDVVKTFDRWWPALRAGGLYVIEDVVTQYWQDHNDWPVSMAEVARSLVDCAMKAGAWTKRSHVGWSTVGPAKVLRHGDVAELHAYYNILFVRKDRQ